jgi:hypothetical protein
MVRMDFSQIELMGGNLGSLFRDLTQKLAGKTKPEGKTL